MYNAWDAHYRKINVLRFTQDGEALVSGSEDSGVSVWSVVRCVVASITTLFGSSRHSQRNWLFLGW